MKVHEQVLLKTWKQQVTCECCSGVFNITVSGVKKSNHRSYREYRGTCRKCGTMYSAIKWAVSY